MNIFVILVSILVLFAISILLLWKSGFLKEKPILKIGILSLTIVVLLIILSGIFASEPKILAPDNQSGITTTHIS